MQPDFSRSRAILISNAVFTDEKIEDLPAARGCAPAMRELLTSELCGWPADRVELLADVTAPHALATRLVELTDRVEDVLLLYYVGHGMRIPTGQLALALRDTSSNRVLLRHTAMVYKDVADILRDCPATTKLVILDCCHAELGNRASDQLQSAELDAEPVDGLYCIWASKEWENAKSPLSGGLTYFTEAFVEVVRGGIAGKSSRLSIDQIFVELRARLLRAGRPEPAQSGIRDAHHWPFALNAAPPETHRDLERENASLLEWKAVAEATEKSLRAEIERLKAQVPAAGTTHERRQLQSAIDSAERLLDDTVAPGTAGWSLPAEPTFTPAARTDHGARARPGRPGGRLLYRYELEGVIGRGGMAEVYRARDVRMDRIVAVKTLRPELAGDQAFRDRFAREAQSAASLNSPSIVAVYDTGEDRSTGVPVLYTVMEYVDGRTVRDLLDEGHRLLPERTLEITSGVLRALEYSHQAGVVHRNIKPGNVIISRFGDVKVMDFGIARSLSDVRGAIAQTAQVMGTVYYLSPEQARGERVDSRSDMYSTGCLMYELLLGRPPFTGDSAVAIAYQHVRENPVPPSRLDPDLAPWADAIVLKAMAKSPDERYQTAAEMNEDLQRAASGLPLAAAAESLPAEGDYPGWDPAGPTPGAWRRIRDIRRSK